ncbi:hypothetical protein ACHHYP_04892 [Achlya hypogyna]|uniref:Uncharacterized protein n=1 Tax=Achlya hypogyna TaxID=1202772 RepID=A0A1V9YZP6_ACHHY|nr:hypothetical protein ACHHYP_04892 [Achlya hypogyna]
MHSTAHVRLDQTRVEILRSAVRLPKGQLKPSRRCIYFVLKVQEGASYRIVEHSWSVFRSFQSAVMGVDKHECHGLCAALQHAMRHQLRLPVKKVGFRTWCKIHLHHHTETTIELFREHFQDFLDLLLFLLQEPQARCAAFGELPASRAEILRVDVRAPKPTKDDVIFLLRVHDAGENYGVQQSWTAFDNLRNDLLRVLAPGHVCDGVCPWLWEELRHNFDFPTKKVGFFTWLDLRLQRQTTATIEVYREHFQQLLDALVGLLCQTRIHCERFHGVYTVVAKFLTSDPKDALQCVV